MQVIFHTLPLLCDSPREDLIPPERFMWEAQGIKKLFYELSCRNVKLLEAAHHVITSTSFTECGSDTKSIAHQVRNCLEKNFIVYLRVTIGCV